MATAEYKIILDDGNATAKLEKISKGFRDVDGGAEKVGKSFERMTKKTNKATEAFGGMKGAIGLVAGSAVIGALVSGVNASIEAYDKQAKADAKLANALKSTGNQIGYTVEELKAMASELQKTTLFGDEATQEAQAMALTFTKIGKDVFPEVIKMAQDMSSFLGKDLNSTMTQLGKAMQDPIEGATALKKAGVILSDAQEKQIKKFVELNDVASAQRVILNELSIEFGGAAQSAANAGAGGITQLMNAFGDTQELIGESLIPTINFYTEKLVSLNSWIQKVITSNKEMNSLEKTTGDLQIEASNQIDEQIDKLSKLDKKRQETIDRYVSMGFKKNANDFLEVKQIDEKILAEKEQLKIYERKLLSLAKLARQQHENSEAEKNKPNEPEKKEKKLVNISRRESDEARLLKEYNSLLEKTMSLEDERSDKSIKNIVNITSKIESRLKLESEMLNSMATIEGDRYKEIIEKEAIYRDAKIDDAKIDLWYANAILEIENEIAEEKKRADKEEDRHNEELRKKEIEIAEEKKRADEEDDRRNEELHKKEMARKQELMSAIGQSASNLSQTFRNYTELELRAIEDKYEKQEQSAEQAYKNELAIAGSNANARQAVEQRYSAKVEKLQQQRASAEDSAKRKTFEITKHLDTLSAVMNTAVAVTSALTVPPPMGEILAATIGALGATQVGLIQSQKMASGGMPVGRNAVVTMNERGQEAIINDVGYRNLGRDFVTKANAGYSIEELSASLGRKSGSTINITVGGYINDQRTISEHLMPALRKELRRVA